jgi:hypothetical protein
MATHDLFLTVRTEGGLLPSDLLQSIAAGDRDVQGLRPEDYGLAPGEKLNEAIARSWNRLTGLWHLFRAWIDTQPVSDFATGETRRRWLVPLFEELGYRTLAASPGLAVDGRSYPISHSYQHAFVHLLGWRLDLDTRTAEAAGAARRSPHGLVQEFLNRSDAHLWAVLSNGRQLRLLRDNASLTRQAFVEFDLESMFDGEVYPDFALLWLVTHASRVAGDKPDECWLEQWNRHVRESGVRALDHLRDGVEACIELLGQGFLRHPVNDTLRGRLRSGDLDKQDLYRQVLRLVYRLLFLAVAEERDLLHAPGVEAAPRERFRRFYSLGRLRRLADRRRGTRHGDLWHGLRLVFGFLGADAGCPALGLTGLGSFLWSPDATPDLDAADLENVALLSAVRALAFTEREGRRHPVDFKNLRSEELGSVYESLLELHPQVDTDAATFVLKTAGGHERKTTGSYYTPESLVQCLLDSALDPVVEEAVRKAGAPGIAEKAVLSLKVCDPACGSGHFLVAAAHRLARRLAAVRTGDEEPAPEALRHAMRDVIGHCLYGVDLNPMAVELCKVSLWLEAMEPGRPLSFLDAHVQCGNSVLGTTPALLAQGLPDEAFTALEGDDKPTCTALRKRNRKEREGQADLFSLAADQPWLHLGCLASTLINLEGLPEENLTAVRDKEKRWKELTASSSYEVTRLWADAWCAAFVWSKTPKAMTEGSEPITQDALRLIERNPKAVPTPIRQEVRRLAEQYRFFHWHLAFPGVFRLPHANEGPENEGTGWSGGFDVVLGNPPWERVKLQEQEFFAERSPHIANAPNAAARKKLIAALPVEDPSLWSAWTQASREAEGASALLRSSGRFPLCGKGDVNTFSVFAELKRQLLSQVGQVGCIVPSGIATDDTTKFFFSDLVLRNSLVSLYEFINEEHLFPGIDHRNRYCLITMAAPRDSELIADLVFGIFDPARLDESVLHIHLTAKDFALLNPNTGTCPIFRSGSDAELTKAIHRRVPILLRENDPRGSLWGVSFMRMFDMANDSRLFRTKELVGADDDIRPLYEAKMAHHFDHRHGTYEGQTEAQAAINKLPEPDSDTKANPAFQIWPRYWLAASEVEARLAGRWDRGWLLGWRDITNATNERTVIASVLPRVAVGHTTPLFFPCAESISAVPGLSANLASFAMDYAARQKVGGTHLTYTVINQLPVLPPATYDRTCRWYPLREAVPPGMSPQGSRLSDWLLPRVLELTYTAWDLQPFALDCGYDGPPFRWDDERRFLLRAELDAAFFHLYLESTATGEWKPAPDETPAQLAELKAHFPTPRHAVEYILETFPIVKKRDIARYGDYRTKATIVQMYDQMQTAIATGVPYRTWLEPPPADARVAHEAR